ncbi:hypothetical protein C1Y63_01510 [Corynebacterium sp. 13CS0277]|uniref:DUF4232 domain-containing protein n=1 Tax=Corynebacterium sp. 13CS0277 TaxID=2071994 RepID=UPI000D044A75|nr:DUF4232 domain-containing protein [Corynebacterium sp. 13CS0277]PRQ12266.1 hypothetical protein C1Y63_01510 [Corynebacterium sp. 13CS0277]
MFAPHRPHTTPTPRTPSTAARLKATGLAVCGAGLLLVSCSTPAEHTTAHPEVAPAVDATTTANPTQSPAQQPAQAAQLPPLKESQQRAASPATREACQPGQLQARLDGPQGTAGHQLYRLQVTNTGPHCTLLGYPGVSLVNAAGTQLGHAATRTGAEFTAVRLGPQASATATIRITSPGTMDPSVCQPAQAAAAVVFPPNSFDSFQVPLQAEVCAGDVDAMDVSPFQAN